MGRQSNDPFSELLRPPLNFKSEDEQFAHLKQVSEALSWAGDLDYPVLVADAMVSEFPAVAVSEGFVRESQHPRENILFQNFRLLVERVTGPDAIRISRSDLENVNAFCKLSRFPGTVESGGAIRDSQPNVLGDGSCVMTHSVVFRVYVSGHPFLVGLQKFDQSLSCVPPEENDMLINERIENLTTQMAQSETLRKLFRSDGVSETAPTSRDGLYRGEKVSPNLVFFDQGHGVLRQEPQHLPQSGTIFTARAIPMSSDGTRRITIRLDTIMPHNWPDESGPPMGFTQTHPASDDLTHFTKLHFVGRTVGFTCIGPIVNNSKVTLTGMGKWKDQLDIFPKQTFPESFASDIVTVELTKKGELKRYHNGKLINTVATNKALEDGEWYGAFEVSMNIARATLLDFDPHLGMAGVSNL